jgi:hypothetical protein
MIAYAIIAMMQRKLDYMQEEVRVLKEPLHVGACTWINLD